jgi:hypothetical protein
MQPKFQTMEAWQQAELLMQPAFIRLIDNLRKQLEQSTWKGTYRDVPMWAEDVSEEIKLKVQLLQEELKTATPEQADDIRQALAELPLPNPGYELCLEQDDRQVCIDMWEICYQVCFQSTAAGQPVLIDTSLLNAMGEVDWHQLDNKAKLLVEQIFANLAGEGKDQS